MLYDVGDSTQGLTPANAGILSPQLQDWIFLSTPFTVLFRKQQQQRVSKRWYQNPTYQSIRKWRCIAYGVNFYICIDVDRCNLIWYIRDHGLGHSCREAGMGLVPVLCLLLGSCERQLLFNCHSLCSWCLINPATEMGFGDQGYISVSKSM